MKKKTRYVHIKIFIQFQNPHAYNKVFVCLFSIFLSNIDTGHIRALPFSRSSRLLIRLPHFQIFHLPSHALRGSREKYLATSRDGLYGISAGGTEFLLFRGIIRKKSRWRGIYSGGSRGPQEGMRYQRRMAPEGKGRSEKKKVDPMQSDSRRKILTSMRLIHMNTLKANVHGLFLSRDCIGNPGWLTLNSLSLTKFRY